LQLLNPEYLKVTNGLAYSAEKCCPASVPGEKNGLSVDGDSKSLLKRSEFFHKFWRQIWLGRFDDQQELVGAAIYDCKQKYYARNYHFLRLGFSTGGGKGAGDIDFGVKMKFNDEIDFYVYR
jgi:hypothetical protein